MTPATHTFLRMESIVKTFPGVTANRGVSLEVREGEIHALLGENGAGKTVLMSILYGLCRPDAGRVIYKDKPVRFGSPKEARRRRIGMVHQHFMLVPTLTVAENIVLGQHRPWKLLYDMFVVEERIRGISREFHLEVDPTARVSDLSVGEQQRVEILKTLYHGADLLILDEPTAVLTPQETQDLLRFLRGLVDRGLTIIFITHKLEEVMQASDRVTVLRDGRKVATLQTAETNPRELARLMVGRDVLMELPRNPARAGNVVLSVEGLCVDNDRGLSAVRDVSFEVREREIVGVAGVSGNGQSELALALTGLMKNSRGRILLAGREIQDASPRAVSELGLTHVPEDRHKLGVILPFTVAENLIMHRYNRPPFAHKGFLRRRRIAGHARELVRKFDVRVSHIDEELAHLSGGNQQKVVVARELDRQPKLLLVNQPTRGIDIGATEFVLQQILAERDQGTAVLLISTELEELFAISDRILVMFEGRIVGKVPPDRNRIEEVGLMMAGRQREAAS